MIHAVAKLESRASVRSLASFVLLALVYVRSVGICGVIIFLLPKTLLEATAAAGADLHAIKR